MAMRGSLPIYLPADPTTIGVGLTVLANMAAKATRLPTLEAHIGELCGRAGSAVAEGFMPHHLPRLMHGGCSRFGSAIDLAIRSLYLTLFGGNANDITMSTSRPPSRGRPRSWPTQPLHRRTLDEDRPNAERRGGPGGLGHHGGDAGEGRCLIPARVLPDP